MLIEPALGLPAWLWTSFLLQVWFLLSNCLQALRPIIASSVDAERAFSVGCLQVNHLQHGISSQSFKALVAIGSWYNTPLMPKDLKAATAAVESQAERKGKGKANIYIIEIMS